MIIVRHPRRTWLVHPQEPGFGDFHVHMDGGREQTAEADTSCSLDRSGGIRTWRQFSCTLLWSSSLLADTRGQLVEYTSFQSKGTALKVLSFVWGAIFRYRVAPIAHRRPTGWW